jgi:hypothetical protein
VAQVRDLLDRPDHLKPVWSRVSPQASQKAPVEAAAEASAGAPVADKAPAPEPVPADEATPAETAATVSAAPAAGSTPPMAPKAATRADASQVTSSAEPAGPIAPPGAQSAAAEGVHGEIDAASAQVIDDLDRTFAFIAAQANQDALSTPPPPSAVAAPKARDARQPLRPYRHWLGGTAAAALAAVLIGAWLLVRPDPGVKLSDSDGSLPAAVAQPAAPSTTLSSQPSGAETRDPTASAAVAAVGAVAATPGPGTASESPAAPAPAARAPPASAAGASPSPRALCGKNSGYALYQCMQTQCAKRTFLKHSQCQNLRKNQTLG